MYDDLVGMMCGFSCFYIALGFFFSFLFGLFAAINA